MKRILSSLNTINKTIQASALFLISLLLLGLLWLGYSIWAGYLQREANLKKQKEVISKQRQTLNKQKQQLKQKTEEIQKLRTTVRKQEERIQQLRTQIRLLKVNHRVGRLRILSKKRDPETGIHKTLVEFVELDQDGNAIGAPKQYNLRGEIVYIDGWIVKFKDKYVEHSTLPRSSSVILFHRIYGQKQPPETGYQLDKTGSVPRPYRGNRTDNNLIQTIFQDFWKVANQPSLQNEMGIRAAHGTAGYIKAVAGKEYRVSLRASGDVSILPESSPAKE